MVQLHELVSLLGVAGLLILIAIVLGAGLLALYTLLHFGDTSLGILKSFVREMVVALRYESSKAHPAIRVEFRLHQFFMTAFLLSSGALILHSLLPWARKPVEDALLVLVIASFVIIAILAGVSMRLALRLP